MLAAILCCSTLCYLECYAFQQSVPVCQREGWDAIDANDANDANQTLQFQSFVKNVILFSSRSPKTSYFLMAFVTLLSKCLYLLVSHTSLSVSPDKSYRVTVPENRLFILNKTDIALKTFRLKTSALKKNKMLFIFCNILCETDAQT